MLEVYCGKLDPEMIAINRGSVFRGRQFRAYRPFVISRPEDVDVNQVLYRPTAHTTQY